MPRRGAARRGAAAGPRAAPIRAVPQGPRPPFLCRPRRPRRRRAADGAPTARRAASRPAVPTRGELRLARATAPSPREATPPLQPSRSRRRSERPVESHLPLAAEGERAVNMVPGCNEAGSAMGWRKRGRVHSADCRRPESRATGALARAEGVCCHRQEGSAGWARAWRDAPRASDGRAPAKRTSIAHAGCQHSPSQKLSAQPVRPSSAPAEMEDEHERARRRGSATHDATPAEGAKRPRRTRRPCSSGGARGQPRRNGARCRRGKCRAAEENRRRLGSP